MSAVNIETTTHALEAENGPYIIRYSVDGALLIDGEIYRGRTYASGEPMTPDASFRLKWDGCTNVWFNGAWHFDTLEEIDAFRECMRFIREDLCDKHGIAY